VRRLIAASGAELEPEIQGEPAAGEDRQALDSSAIREELGWAPRWDLDRGLGATWAWYRGGYDPSSKSTENTTLST
jgi:dTDP-glucose 4,6-dehydratase